LGNDRLGGALCAIDEVRVDAVGQAPPDIARGTQSRIRIAAVINKTDDRVGERESEPHAAAVRSVASHTLRVMNDRLYTKNGRPLQVHNDKLYSRWGQYLGRIRNGKVFDPAGRYAATVVGERVVYRGSDSGRVSGPSSSGNRGGIGAGNRGAVGIWGDEPGFPD
jgi:hypothetical protein